jgi:hypothetical protein
MISDFPTYGNHSQTKGSDLLNTMITKAVLHDPDSFVQKAS